MTQLKYFILNGHKFHATHDLTISDLVEYFGYNTALLVLEHNNLICNKEKWSKTYIQQADKIEFLTIVGGG